MLRSLSFEALFYLLTTLDFDLKLVFGIEEPHHELLTTRRVLQCLFELCFQVYVTGLRCFQIRLEVYQLSFHHLAFLAALIQLCSLAVRKVLLMLQLRIHKFGTLSPVFISSSYPVIHCIQCISICPIQSCGSTHERQIVPPELIIQLVFDVTGRGWVFQCFFRGRASWAAENFSSRNPSDHRASQPGLDLHLF